MARRSGGRQARHALRSAPLAAEFCGTSITSQGPGAARVRSLMEANPHIRYGDGDRGWIGDNPFIFLDTAKIRSLGWGPKLTIREGIIRTLDYLQQHPALLEARA